MSDDLVTFIIDGSEPRGGAIPANVFIAKLTAFIGTLYGFERAFTRHAKRQIDLEISGLEKNSPGRVAMRPRSRVSGYDGRPGASVGF